MLGFKTPASVSHNKVAGLLNVDVVYRMRSKAEWKT